MLESEVLVNPQGKAFCKRLLPLSGEIFREYGIMHNPAQTFVVVDIGAQCEMRYRVLMRIWRILS